MDVRRDQEPFVRHATAGRWEYGLHPKGDPWGGTVLGWSPSHDGAWADLIAKLRRRMRLFNFAAALSGTAGVMAFIYVVLFQ